MEIKEKMWGTLQKEKERNQGYEYRITVLESSMTNRSNFKSQIRNLQDLGYLEN